MKCYGCDEEIKIPYKLMKVEGEIKRQPFCRECATRLIKIKLGML